MPDFLVQPRNESLANGSKAAAPGLGVAVATLTPSDPGYYQVDVYAGLSGTLAAVDASNFEFRKGSTVICVLAVAGNGTGATASNTSIGPFTFFVNLNGSTSISVNATAAATASSVYHCTMIATKLN